MQTNKIAKKKGIMSNTVFFYTEQYYLFKKKGNYQWLQNISSMYKGLHIKAYVDA